MVRDNKAFFRAGVPLAPVAILMRPEEAIDATQMHVINVYALGDEIAGHEVRNQSQLDDEIIIPIQFRVYPVFCVMRMKSVMRTECLMCTGPCAWWPERCLDG